MANNFEFIPTLLNGLVLIKPFIATDNRGAFIKDYSYETFLKEDNKYSLQEAFYTVSKKGVVRGMHFQKVKQQPKLVRCISGEVYDVVVDLRKDSPTFKCWMGFYLNDKNNYELLIPEGFAHGYMVLEDSIVSYKCAEKFYGSYDSGIKYDDEDINIEWPYDRIGGKDKVILSDKDMQLQSFQHFVDNYESEF